MRALEKGMSVGTFEIKGSDFAVDVNADLLRAIDVMPKDKIRSFIKNSSIQIKNSYIYVWYFYCYL